MFNSLHRNILLEELLIKVLMIHFISFQILQILLKLVFPESFHARIVVNYHFFGNHIVDNLVILV